MFSGTAAIAQGGLVTLAHAPQFERLVTDTVPPWVERARRCQSRSTLTLSIPVHSRVYIYNEWTLVHCSGPMSIMRIPLVAQQSIDSQVRFCYTCVNHAPSDG